MFLISWKVSPSIHRSVYEIETGYMFSSPVPLLLTKTWAGACCELFVLQIAPLRFVMLCYVVNTDENCCEEPRLQ